jgi:acyl-CoA reductase-like NAD-dependent aldehyde dehydrogenase
MEALSLINNDSAPGPPLGDFRHSGWGREKSQDVLDLYTEVESVVVAL